MLPTVKVCLEYSLSNLVSNFVARTSSMACYFADTRCTPLHLCYNCHTVHHFENSHYTHSSAGAASVARAAGVGRAAGVACAAGEALVSGPALHSNTGRASARCAILACAAVHASVVPCYLHYHTPARCAKGGALYPGQTKPLCQALQLCLASTFCRTGTCQQNATTLIYFCPAQRPPANTPVFQERLGSKWSF